MKLEKKRALISSPLRSPDLFITIRSFSLTTDQSDLPDVCRTVATLSLPAARPDSAVSTTCRTS